MIWWARPIIVKRSRRIVRVSDIPLPIYRGPVADIYLNSDVEAFTAFRELRSPNWHRRRQEVAQTFLDQFVRQVNLSLYLILSPANTP